MQTKDVICSNDFHTTECDTILLLEMDALTLRVLNHFKHRNSGNIVWSKWYQNLHSWSVYVLAIFPITRDQDQCSVVRSEVWSVVSSKNIH